MARMFRITKGRGPTAQISTLGDGKSEADVTGVCNDIKNLGEGEQITVKRLSISIPAAFTPVNTAGGTSPGTSTPGGVAPGTSPANANANKGATGRPATAAV